MVWRTQTPFPGASSHLEYLDFGKDKSRCNLDFIPQSTLGRLIDCLSKGKGKKRIWNYLAGFSIGCWFAQYLSLGLAAQLKGGSVNRAQDGFQS